MYKVPGRLYLFHPTHFPEIPYLAFHHDGLQHLYVCLLLMYMKGTLLVEKSTLLVVSLFPFKVSS
jgi:hypothetical protein